MFPYLGMTTAEAWDYWQQEARLAKLAIDAAERRRRQNAVRGPGKLMEPDDSSDENARYNKALQALHWIDAEGQVG